MIPRLAILISGRGSNMQTLAQRVQDGILAGQCEIAVVISSRPDAAGLELAQQMGIATVELDVRGMDKAAYDDSLLSTLAEHHVDVVVLAGYMRILSPRVVSHYRNRILNIHPADTALHQGLGAYDWAFEQKQPSTKITVHLVDEGLDTGTVIAQREVNLTGATSLEEVEQRGLAVEHELYPEALASFLTSLTLNPEN